MRRQRQQYLSQRLLRGRGDKIPVIRSAVPSSVSVAPNPRCLRRISNNCGTGLRDFVRSARRVDEKLAGPHPRIKFATSPSFSFRTSARFARSITNCGSTNGGRRFTSKNFNGPLTASSRSNSPGYKGAARERTKGQRARLRDGGKRLAETLISSQAAG